MADSFAIELPKNWRARWPEVRAAASKYDFELHKHGDDVTFSGFGIVGSIIVDGNTAYVTIERKPFFLTTSYIVEKVENFLKGQRIK